MRKLLIALVVVLWPLAAVAQPDLTNKEWYSMSQEGAAPPQFFGNEFLKNVGWQNNAGNMCFPQADAGCNLFTAPGAGAIWEVRVRDGNGATLADVSQPSALTTNWTEYFLNTLAAIHGMAYDDLTLFVPTVVIAGAGQRDNITNNTPGLVTTSFGYVLDAAGTWDRIRLGTQTAAMSLATAPPSDAYYMVSRTAAANTVANTIYIGISDGTTLADVLDASGDNLANNLNGLVVDNRNLLFDGTAWDRALSGATGELQVTDVAVRPGEDAGNDWRKIKKEQTAVVTPAKTTTTVDSLEDVLASREILSDVNWTVCAENTGGAALTALNIEVSPDGVIWLGLTAAPAAGYSGVRADGWSATLAAAAIGCYSVSNSSYRYLRVQANCGTTTTLDVWYHANKN